MPIILLKFLRRNIGFSIINIIGFSLSLTAVVLLSAYTYHELNIDKFHENKDNIWAFINKGSEGHMYYTPPALAEEFTQMNPEIKSFTRMFGIDDILRYKGEKFRCNIMTCDTSFFDIFSYNIIDGERNNIFRKNSAEIAISESFSRKVFGDE